MSASPPKDTEAEAEVLQSPDDTENKQEGNGNMTGLGPEAGLYDTEVKEQDRWLPIANVARIMKTALPENAKIAKEAKECMQECVSEFISFITSEASEKCQQEKRKTVNGEDILFAMASLGFENYGEALKIYLARYRETQVAKTDSSQNRPASGYGSSGDVVGQEDDHAIPTANAAGAGSGSGPVDGASTYPSAAPAAPALESTVGEEAGFNSY